MTNKKPDDKQSFITEARREQITQAAIMTLDEIGFVNASLAQIAKRAGISTALISYHFKDKQDLMDHTLMYLTERSTTYILEQTEAVHGDQQKLHTFIDRSLAYQVEHPKHYVALVEIVFNARTADNVPYYKLSDDEDEPILALLQQILQAGQRNGVFRAFNVQVMARVIQTAIGEYVLDPNLARRIDLTTYRSELKEMFDRMVISELAA